MKNITEKSPSLSGFLGLRNIFQLQDILVLVKFKNLIVYLDTTFLIFAHETAVRGEFRVLPISMMEPGFMTRVNVILQLVTFA